MNKLILSNPFRMLGVYVNGRQADIMKNMNRAKAFLHVGKPVSFPTDTLLGLEAPERTEASMLQAQSALDLPKDRLQVAFFWLGQETPGEQTGWVSVLERAVRALLGDNPGQAAQHYSRLLHEEALRTAFVQAVCGDAFEISETDLTGLLWTRLLEAVPYQSLLPYMTEKDAAFVRDHALSGHIRRIKDEIAQAGESDSSDSEAQRLAGIRLKEQTTDSLSQLRETAGEDHPDYKATADSLARQILQNCINFFNESDETSEDIRVATELAEYALGIACSPIVKKRCQMNLETLESRKKSAAYQKEISAIFALLRPYTSVGGNSGEKSITAAERLLEAALPQLSSLRQKAGDAQEHHLDLSSSIANLCLNIIVEVINEKQGNAEKSELHDMAKRSNSLIDKLLTMNINQETRNRLKENNDTLQSILSATAPSYSWIWWLLAIGFLVFRASCS